MIQSDGFEFWNEGEPDPAEVAALDARYPRVNGELRWRSAMRGAGDLVKRVTDALGIRQCGGCKSRQEALNKLLPFSE